MTRLRGKVAISELFRIIIPLILSFVNSPLLQESQSILVQHKTLT